MADVENDSTVSLLGTDADGAPPRRPRRPRESRSSIFLLLQSAKSRLAGVQVDTIEESSESSGDDKPAEDVGEGPAGRRQRHPSVFKLLKQATARIGGAEGTAGASGRSVGPTRSSSTRASSGSIAEEEAHDEDVDAGPTGEEKRRPRDSLGSGGSGVPLAPDGPRASGAPLARDGLELEVAGEVAVEDRAEKPAGAARGTAGAGDRPPRAGCAWCAAIFGLLTGALGAVLFVALFAFQGQGPATPCAGRLVPVTYVHRGNLKYAQENTFAAVVTGAAAEGVSPEIDVRALKDGGVVLFHDENMQRVTGVDKDIKDVTTAEALGTPISMHIDGHAYNSTNTIPELKQVVEAVCDLNDTSVGLNFDTKVEGAVSATVAALKNSNCADTSHNVIWSTADPTVVKSVSRELKQSGLKNRVAMYMPSGKYAPLGLKFFLKTRLLHALFPGSSIVEVHKTVFDAEADLVQSWREDGWCVGVWGLTPHDVRSYDVDSNYDVDVFIVDEAPAFPDLKDANSKYEDDSLTSYYVLIVVAAVLVLASVVLIASAWRQNTRAAKAARAPKAGDARDDNEDLENFPSEVTPL